MVHGRGLLRIVRFDAGKYAHAGTRGEPFTRQLSALAEHVGAPPRVDAAEHGSEVNGRLKFAVAVGISPRSAIARHHTGGVDVDDALQVALVLVSTSINMRTGKTGHRSQILFKSHLFAAQTHFRFVQIICSLIDGACRGTEVEVAQLPVAFGHGLGQGKHEVGAAEHISVVGHQGLVGIVLSSAGKGNGEHAGVVVYLRSSRINRCFAEDGVAAQVIGGFGGQFVLLGIFSTVAPEQGVEDRGMP